MKKTTKIELFDEVSDGAYVLMERANAAINGKQFKQRPRVAWRYPLDEDGIQYIELHPEYITIEQAKRNVDYLVDDGFEYIPFCDSNFQFTGVISLDVGVDVDGEIRRSRGVFYVTDNLSGLYLTYSKRDESPLPRGSFPHATAEFIAQWDAEEAEDIEAAVKWNKQMAATAPAVAAAVKIVVESPEKLSDLEASSCCYCGRGLLDAESVSRGYGPDCAKQFCLPYVPTPSKWKEKRPEPNIIDNLTGQVLTSLQQTTMLPTEVNYYLYTIEGQQVDTRIEPRALLYQGSKIAKYRRKVTVITPGAMDGRLSMEEVSLVSLAIEKHAQYERSLSVRYVLKRERTTYSRNVTPDYHDHNISPFYVMVDGWGHGARRQRKPGEEWQLVSGFPLPAAPKAPKGTPAEDKRAVEADLHIKAFIEPWLAYVAREDVNEIVRLIPNPKPEAAA